VNCSFRESSNLWTHIALFGIPGSMSVWVSVFNLKAECLIRASLVWTWTVVFSNTVWNEYLPQRNLDVLAADRASLFHCRRDCLASCADHSKSGCHFDFWSQIRQDYPLNLSILISGGKETNKDSPSNGEWSGKSSNLKPPRRIVVCRGAFDGRPGKSPLE
jgi:hypothetical protein